MCVEDYKEINCFEYNQNYDDFDVDTYQEIMC